MLNEGDCKEMDLQKTELQRLLRSSTSESRRAGIRASLKSLDAMTPRGGCDETSSADPDAAEESRESIAPLSLNKQSMMSGGWNSGGGGALSARRKSRSTIEMDAIPEHSKPGKQAAGSVAAVHSWGVGLNRNASTTDGIKESGVGSTNQITELNTTHYIAEAYASSFDPRHPAADIFNPGTFWISTGGYPQTLRLRFRKHVELRRIAILASGVVALSVAGDATGNSNDPTWSACNDVMSHPLEDGMTDSTGSHGLRIFTLDTKALTANNGKRAWIGLAINLEKAEAPFCVIQGIRLWGKQTDQD